jgi:hypothetical protein
MTWGRILLFGAVGGLLGGAVGAVVGSLDPEADLPEWRKAMLRKAREHLAARTLYQWGGGRSPNDYGVDCSGMVLTCLREAGVSPPPEGGTSYVWWDVLPRVEVPQPGDVALFGRPERAVHVTLVEYPLEGGDAMTIGANGGDKDVNTPQIAESRNAFVSRKRAREWKNFLGYCTFDPEIRAAQTAGMKISKLVKPIMCCD